MERAAIYNITIRKNNDFEQLFEFQLDDGTSMDLTGWVVKSQVRQNRLKSSLLLLTFTVHIPSPADGKVYLQLMDTQTDALISGVGYYDILLTSPTAFDETFVEGECYIEDTVTEKS